MSDQVRSGPEALGVFVKKTLCFCLVAYLGLYVPGWVLERFVPWGTVLDPRQKILWAGAYDGSRVVLLGDSAFISYYVNAPELTLWRRLEDLSGEKVFPGALDGSRLLETGLTAKLVAQTWPRGTVVFINLIPTRFMSERLANEKRGRHYDSLVRLVLDDLSLPSGMSWMRIERQATFALGHPLFLVRAGDTVVGGALSRYLWPRCDFVPSLGRDVNWHDLQGFARARFLRFREQCVVAGPPASLAPLAVIGELFERTGIVPVFVLTPLNREVARAFAPEGGVRELHFLDALHARTLRFLEEQKLQFIDLYDSLPTECFVDLLHTNARGDEALARAMNDWLRDHRRPGSGV